MSPARVRPDLELRGTLPCARCRYELQGLSVRATCPECGLPVRATILARVDPLADELRPLSWPRATAVGVVVWSLAAVLAAAGVWWLRIEELVGAHWFETQAHGAVLVLVLVGLSGLGAIALIAPHAGIPRTHRLLAFAGVLFYVPLLAALWRLHVVIDARGIVAYGLGATADLERSTIRVVALALLGGIMLCLRINARRLAARSFLMRTGRTDRQTIAAMLGVLGVIALGDALLLWAGAAAGPREDQFRLVGQLIILVGSVLLTLGLVGVLADCVRLAPVLRERPLSLREIVELREGQASGQALGQSAAPAPPPETA